MTSVLQLRSFSDEMQKIAATRGAKIVSSLVAQAKGAFKSGNKEQGEAFLARANKMAKTPGVIKSSPGGSQLKRGIRGAGSEGSVTEVMDPQFGISMRKTYDPQGLSTQQLIKRKDVAGKAIGKSEDVAEYYGQRATPKVRIGPGVHKRTKGTMQFSEPVYSAPGVSKPSTIQAAPDYAAAKDKARAAYSKTPYSDPQDIRAANMIRDVRTGKLKTVDTIPARPGEFISQADREFLDPKRFPENMLGPISDAGEKLVKDPTRAVSPNQLNRSLLGTGSPRARGAVPQPSVRRTGMAKTPATMEPGTVPNRMPVGSSPASAGAGTAAARPRAMRSATGPGTMPARPGAMKATVPGRPMKPSPAGAATVPGKLPKPTMPKPRTQMGF